MYAAREYGSTSIWTRIVNVIGPRSLMTWLLLLVTLAVMAAGLVDVVSGLEFAFAFAVVATAMTLGWLVGAVPIHPALGWSFGFIVGFEYLLIRVGRLGPAVINIARAFLIVVGQIAAWVWDALRFLASYSFKEREFARELVRTVDWAAVPEAFTAVWTGMGTLLTRAYTWLASIFSEGVIQDPVGAALVWGAVLWLCAFWAGWMVSRKQRPLVAVVPSGFLLSFVLAYTWARPGVLLPMLGLVLILIALIHHRAREAQWNIIGIDFSRDLWGELAMIATGVSLGLVLLAAVLPTVSFEKLAEWIEEVTGPDEEETQMEQVAESLGLEQQPRPQPVRPVQLASSTDLPRRHLIGSGPELSRIVQFVVETGELPPLVDELLEAEVDFIVPRHYWRSITYDRYFGRGWATSGSEQIEYNAGEALVNPETITNTRVLRQEVRVVGELGNIVHVDGELVSMDQDYTVAWRPSNDVFAVTSEERTYTADSLMPVFTVEQLQAASTEYPQWILDRYLQLPEDVPERVLALARDLTATEPTPFDRAVAIESYLREFPYTLDVPRPGAQDDIADYFLFQLQEGYCDYYATSMVVLARAAGLPSRMAVGYATGRYDYGNARYIVTEADAHAWVEIYFPDYGWITFEPTGGRPAIDRPREEEPLIWPEREPLAPLTAATPPETESPAARVVFGQWVMIVVGAGVLIVAGASGLDNAVLMRRSPDAMAASLYGRLRKEARRLNVSQRSGDTPYEFGSAFIKKILSIAQSRNDGDLLPPAEDEIPVLVDLYVKAWYSPHAITANDRKSAVWAWWKLQWRLILARLWRKRHIERSDMPEEESKPVARPSVPPPRMPL